MFPLRFYVAWVILKILRKNFTSDTPKRINVHHANFFLWVHGMVKGYKERKMDLKMELFDQKKIFNLTWFGKGFVESCSCSVCVTDDRTKYLLN